MNFSVEERPKVKYRSSPSECVGSENVIARGSPNMVVASSNETPCFRKFEIAFSSFHSKFMIAYTAS
jgi:hypothetical protein